MLNIKFQACKPSGSEERENSTYGMLRLPSVNRMRTYFSHCNFRQNLVMFDS